MAYTQDNVLTTDISGTADAIDGSPAVFAEMTFDRRVKVKRLMFLVTVTVAADTTAPVVEFNHRITPKSATGEVLLGQLTIPDGTAAGTVIYKDIDPVTIGPGESITYEHVTQAADSGTAAGDGFYKIMVDPDPEYVGNDTDMVASA